VEKEQLVAVRVFSLAKMALRKNQIAVAATLTLSEV
jgi:hypothetical protein